MFFAPLMMAGIELVCAVGVFALARTRTVLGFLFASPAGFVGLALVAMSPVLFLLGIVLAAIGIVGAIAKARHAVFVMCAIVATLRLLGGTGWVERGTLLGAFSYEFLRDPPLRKSQSHGPTGAEKIL